MASPEPSKDNFTWAKTGLGEATFSGLSSLTAMRNGGKVSSKTTKVYDNGKLPRALKGFLADPPPQALIKKRLLDAFCELASENDTFLQTTSAALIEGTSTCTLLLARNCPFTKDEKKLLQDLVTEMRQLSQVADYGPLVR
jgi:hypothetical protein